MSKEGEPIRTFSVDSAYRCDDSEFHNRVRIDLTVRVPKDRHAAAVENCVLALIGTLRGMGWVES